MFGGYKEKDVMKIKTELVKRPLVAFDKDTNIKALAATGDCRLFAIDAEHGAFIEKGGKSVLKD